MEATLLDVNTRSICANDQKRIFQCVIIHMPKLCYYKFTFSFTSLAHDVKCKTLEALGMENTPL